MFERYNQSARRAMFFARYELSQLGAAEIGPEHLLLGLMHDATGLVRQILAPLPPLEKVRSEIEGRFGIHERIPTSVEVPFKGESRRALHFAAEEADRLLHAHRGPDISSWGYCASRHPLPRRSSMRDPVFSICVELDTLRHYFDRP